MVELIRRKDADIRPVDVSSVGSATRGLVGSASKFADQVGSIAHKAYIQEQREQEQRAKSEQKAFDASDKLVAADRAGRLENDLLRWNLEQRQKNPNFIGTPDHERAMRDYYAKLSEDYVQGLGEVGRGEFTSKTQNTVNNMIGNDIKWAYQQKIKQGEESAKRVAEAMNETAGMYGANGDVEGFKESHKETRKQLQDYAENAMPNGASAALYEADKKSLINLFAGMAETDPKRAKNLLENIELFKDVVPEDMVDNVNGIVSGKTMRDLNDKLSIVDAGIANEKDKKEKSKLEKAKKQIEKDIKDAQEKDYTDETLGMINKEVSDSVSKTIDYNINLAKKREEAELANQKIGSALDFMDNPIIYKANMDRLNVKTVRDIVPETVKSHPLLSKSPEIENLAKKIYGLSDKVGDGNVSTADLDKIVKKVASITISDNSEIDNNILKAFQGDLALREAGANPEQLQTYHKMVEMAMTDTTFKQGVAALASKPNFNTMFVDSPSRDTGFSSWFRTVKDDDVQYVENMGRAAYFEAMNKMSEPGLTEEERKRAIADALATYDRRIEDAYDFVKRDVIDVDYVKKQLAKTGSAMVELNGNMTKIVGRLPNGEYIIESTGEKVDAKF